MKKRSGDDRRELNGRRTGTERRLQVIPVEIDRRTGIDRRSGEGRRFDNDRRLMSAF